MRRGVKVRCLDPGDASIAGLRDELSLGDNARKGYAQAIPFNDAMFDCVVMSEVLEHLDDGAVHASLEEVQRVLRSGGRLIGTVPADEDLWASMVVCPCCGERFHRWGHVQEFSQQTLRDLLEGHFGSVEVRRLALIDYSRLNWKGKVAAVLRVVQARLGMRGSGQNFYFEAKRG